MGGGMGGSVRVSKMLKFYVKVFYVMARHCQASYPVPVTGLVSSPGQSPGKLLYYPRRWRWRRHGRRRWG